MSTNCKSKHDSEYQDDNIKKYSQRPKDLPSKQFIARNSVLTDLYQNKHTRIIHHIFIIILIGQFFHSAATDILYNGKLDLGVDLIIRGFSNFYCVIIIWICLFSATVSVYFGFLGWATLRIKLKPKSITLQFWDLFWIAGLIAYYIAFLYYPAVAVIVCQLQPAAKFGFTCEILRLILKTYAFVRSNAPNVLNHKNKSDKHQLLCPKFGNYMYFLWASTLIYRDSYPRSTSIRWRFVLNHVLQLAAVIFFASFIFQKYIINVFKDYGRKPFIWQEVIVIILTNTPASMAILIAMFFSIQHAWMNICAEIFTFADRLFYEEWWTVSNYKDYYRKWNILVQDWIYEYIFKDCYRFIIPNNKVAVNYLIFFISALAHEYITAITFGFCVPILFILFFIVGTSLAIIRFNNELVGNVLILYSISFGMSLLSTTFAIEYFYRKNCPEENISSSSYIIPRFFTCKKF